MKKTLAYIVTAIFLGIVVMLFPVLMLYPSQISTIRGLASTPAPLPSPAPEMDTGYVEKATVAVDMAPSPLNLAYAGFIFMLGFVVGLGVSQYYKRRIF